MFVMAKTGISRSWLFCASGLLLIAAGCAQSVCRRRPTRRGSRGTEGSQTRRWRKPDSNSRSHLRRYRCEAQEYGYSRRR
jgi:hypothetical protein